MSGTGAIAEIEAAIERREDEIVALREVLAMLQNDRGLPLPDRDPPPKPAPAAPSPLPCLYAAPSRQQEAEKAAGRGGAFNNMARYLNGVTLSLSPRLTAMFDAMVEGPVSREKADALLGAGQSRSDGINCLKKKVAAAGYAVFWDKARGGYLLTAGKS